MKPILTKHEYLQRLEFKLAALPENERNDALEYYDGYLSDAEDELTAIAGLGQPGEVAADILADYMSRATIHPTGYTSFKEKRRGAKVALAFVVGIFALPIGLPLILTMGILIFTLFIALGSIIFAVLISSGAFLLAGTVSVIAAPFVMFGSVPTGLLALGSGLMSLGAGILAIKLCGVLFNGFAFISRRASRKIIKRRTR